MYREWFVDTASARCLAVMRIVAAVASLWVVADFWRMRAWLLSTSGVCEGTYYVPAVHVNFLEHDRSPVALAVFSFAWLVSTVCLGLGLRSRLAAVASWACMSTFEACSGLVLQGSDDILRLMLWYCCFAPIGLCWSFDSGWSSDARCRAVWVKLWRWQVAVAYVDAAVAKICGAPWVSGNALTIVFQLTRFSTMPGLTTWIAGVPLLCALGGYLTVVCEFMCGLAAGSNRFSRWWLVAMACLHGVMGALMVIGVFPVVMWAMIAGADEDCFVLYRCRDLGVLLWTWTKCLQQGRLLPLPRPGFTSRARQSVR